MKAAAIATIGLETSSKEEFESLGAKDIKVGDGFITFKTSSYKDLAKISYMTRTSSRVFLLLAESKIKKDIDKKTLTKSIKDINLSEWLQEDSTFMVRCVRSGDHNFSSTDFEPVLGELIVEKIEKEKGYHQKVSLDNPDLIIFTYIKDNIYLLGIDFCGFDLSKRDYHIFTNRTSIKGTLAASLLYHSNIKNNMKILDPMCGSGTIIIEAALLSEGTPPHMHQKADFAFNRLLPLKNIDINPRSKPLNLTITGFDPLLANSKSASKNAKIAQVNKQIEISKTDMEWLDTKIGEKSVDLIISRLPSPSQVMPRKKVEKLYMELFYSADYILKGKMILLLLDPSAIIPISDQYKFKLVKNNKIKIGMQEAFVLTFTRT